MNCPKPDQLRLMSMELLDFAAAEALRGHVRECAKCRTAHEQFRRESEEIAAAHRAFALDHDIEREQLMAKLALEPMSGSGSTSPLRPSLARRGRPGGRLRTGGFLMRLNSPYGRGAAGLLAAAACVALAFTIFSEGESKAFARVIQRLREAQTIQCKVHVRSTFSILSEGHEGVRSDWRDQTEEVYFSDTLGSRRDTYQDGAKVSSTYMTPEKIVYLDHAGSRYHVREPAAGNREAEAAVRDVLAERPIPDLHSGRLSDPTFFLETLLGLSAEADRELGWETFGDVEGYGFELAAAKAGFGPPLLTDRPDNLVRIWIEPKTALPLRIELHFVEPVGIEQGRKLSGRISLDATYEDFQLNAPLSAEFMAAEIPAGYRPMENLEEFSRALSENSSSKKEMGEAQFIGALQLFGEHAGRYPNGLNMFEIAQEVGFVLGVVLAEASAAERRNEEFEPPNVNDMGKKLQGLMYFTTLQQSGAAPEYLGAAVKPGDSESVLVRWRLPDGSMRVIYGDLSVETVR